MKKMLTIFFLFLAVHCGYSEETNILNNILYHHYVTMGKTNAISGMLPNPDFEIMSEGWAKSKWSLPYAKPSLATLNSKTTEANEWNRRGLRPGTLTRNEVRILYYLNQLITNSVNFTDVISVADFKKQKRR